MKTSAFFALLTFLAVYLLPTGVAHQRRHRNFAPICAVNVLFGWTFLGWCAALIWALSDNVIRGTNEVRGWTTEEADSGRVVHEPTWMVRARRDAQRFVDRLDLPNTLQLQITETAHGIVLHAPNCSATAGRMQRPYVYPIDAYRHAIALARSGGFQQLLLFLNGDYRPRGTVNGSDVNVMVCDISRPAGRMIHNMLWSEPEGIRVIASQS